MNLRLLRWTPEATTDLDDVVADEEPLEIQLQHWTGGALRRLSLAVILRTPGNDRELISGFLYSEGIVQDPTWISSIHMGSRRDTNVPLFKDIATSTAIVSLGAHAVPNLPKAGRSFYVSSGCGVCGRASLTALRSLAPSIRGLKCVIDAKTLLSLPKTLRLAQSAFSTTGGLHAVGLFAPAGELISMFEDVGRHNAMDKVIGGAFLSDTLPLQRSVLLLSGRASYELLQKAAMAGASMVAAVGAPSSFAVALAEMFDICLIGFLREERFNVYHGAERVHD